MKRITTVLLTILLLTVLLALPVSANGPAPKSSFEVNLKNAPAEACYMDLLVEMTPDDVNYTDNRENFPDPSWAQQEIFSYSDNDYISYTFHYRGAEGNIKIENGKVKFFERSEENLNRFQSVMIAILDENGSIMMISEPFDPDPSGTKVMNLGYAIYDYEADTVEVPNQPQPETPVTEITKILGMYVLGAIISAAVGVLVEWLIARCFVSLLLYQKVIVLTNVITQLTRCILFMALIFLWQNYWFWTLLLEVAVYTGEYLVYCKRIPTAPKKTIISYVIIANTVTLLLGLAFNYFLVD